MKSIVRLVRRCSLTVCLSALALAACPELSLAQREPHIGYVYPAGGRRGTTFEVTVGGQYLDGTSGALCTGEGVRVEVVRHISDLSRGKAVKLLQMLREYGKQTKGRRGGKAAEKNDGGNNEGVEAVTAESIVEQARKFGLDVKTLQDVGALLRTLRDPKRQPNAQIGERVILKIALADDATPGTRRLQLKTPQGLTNALVFEVGFYAEFLEVEPNDTDPRAGIPAELPAVLNGQIMPGDVDRFRFRAAEGTQLVAAVSARSLVPYLADAVPGWFQATLKLTGPDGKQVAFCDDFRFDPDPVLACTIPADGEYVLEIADAIYRGREDFVYRIVLGEVPFVSGIFPLGGPRGKRTEVALAGWNLPVKRLAVTPTGGEDILQVRLPEGGAARSLPFMVGDLPERLETASNDSAGAAQNIELPVIVNGRIERSGDVDVFGFRGRAGQRIVAEVFARRLASPLDSLLKLTDANGKLLAANDDHEDRGYGLVTHHADSRLEFVLPADGTYLLHLVDARNAGGPAHAYRLVLREPKPDFALRVVPANINAAPGMNVPVTVHVLRRDGFNGPVALEAGDLPAGFSLGGNTIPAGQSVVRMTLNVAQRNGRQELKAQSFELKLEGVATVDGRTIRRRAVPSEDMTQAFLWRHLVPVDHGFVTVAGRRRWMPPTSYAPALLKLSAGTTATLKITGPRGPVGQRFEFELDAPPAGIAIDKVDYDPAKGFTMTLKADAETAQAGQAGNLIFSVFSKPRADNERAGRAPRRFQLGVLPALPYEIAAQPR